MQKNKQIALFEGQKIRRTWHEKEWYYSVVDIVAVLTDSPAPRQYWGVLKGREPQLLTICLQLKLASQDGKKYLTDCVHTKNALRLIQSIPSKKAEPFKMWLAQVGQEKPDTFIGSKIVAKRGGTVSGKARTETEKELGRSIISDENYLPSAEPRKKLK